LKEATVAQLNAAVDQIVREMGRLDILVNNAGIIRRARALEFSEQDWDDVIQVNLKALFFLSQAAARTMARQGSGKIIHIAAMADSASETKTVRVEVPYEGSAPAGERVKVSFQAPAGSGGAMEKAEVPLSKKPPGRKE